jgi:hypothetical protein
MIGRQNGRKRLTDRGERALAVAAFVLKIDLASVAWRVRNSLRALHLEGDTKRGKGCAFAASRDGHAKAADARTVAVVESAPLGLEILFVVSRVNAACPGVLT